MAETTFRPGFENPRAAVLERQSFYEAALDNYTKAPAQDPDDFTTMTNVEPIVEGRLQRRRGYALLSSVAIAARRIFESHFASGANRFVMAAADGSGQSTVHNRITSINENGDVGHASNYILTPAASALQPSCVTSRQYVYICDGISGDLKKWDGQDNPATAGSVTDWGLSASGAQFTQTPTAGGTIVLEVGRRYMVAFLYTTTGEAVLYNITSGGTAEEIQTDSVDTGPQAALTSVALASLPLYTTTSTGLVAANIHRVILATRDGGPLDTLYEIGRVADNTTTTFTDSYTEETLLASPVWAELSLDGREIGIYDNTRPSTTIPALSLITTHQGRIYGLSEQFLFWTKNLSEQTTSTNTVTGRFESSWPASYQMPVAIQSEFGRGLLSDGIRLYIGTDRGIRSLEGDYPNFAPLRTVFHEVGLIRQDTWKIISHAGQQVAAVWLTPDRRVIASDFNTYEDIGWAIQDTLNDLDVAAARKCATATFWSDGPYELYVLAIPAPGTSTQIATGTAQAGAATTITLAATSSALDDFYNAATIAITSGTGSGQSKTITDYVGSTKVATVSTWTTNPDSSSVYTISTLEADKLCVYNIKTKHWVVWAPTDVVFSQAFMQDIVNNRPLPIFSTVQTTTGKTYRWVTGTEIETSTNLRDRVSDTPASFVVTMRTSWLDGGMPQVAKFLNELEVYTGDTALTVTIEGANTEAGFTSPTTVLAATAVSALPQTDQYKVGLAALFTKYRFYRFTFSSPAGTSRELLSYLAIESIPFHRF